MELLPCFLPVRLSILQLLIICTPNFIVGEEVKKQNLIPICSDYQEHEDSSLLTPTSKFEISNLDKFGTERISSIHDGTHRVLLGIRWPNLIKSQSFHLGPVCQTDLLPTFAEMRNVNLPDSAGEDSQSLFKILEGEHEFIPVPMIHHSANDGFAIRQCKLKLILLHKKSSYELYDLTADVKENKNITSGNTDLVVSLWNQFSEIIP
jgi:hypothetical protein